MKRLAGRLFVAAGLAFGLNAYVIPPTQAEEFWVKVSNQDCTVWSDSALKDNEVLTWSGDCVDGRASGSGTIEWFVDEKLKGTYEGGMRDGRLDGDGVLRVEEKQDGGFDRLEGTFIAGEPDGKARFDAANGDMYEGGFQDGERHGIGYYRLVNGEEYFGDFEKGQRHGTGLLIDAKGDAYLGEFENGVAKGAGVFEGIDGSKYQGQFANGLPSGAGTYTAPNGDTYQGVFTAGKGNGKFVVTKKDGTQEVQDWKDGEMVK